MAKSTYSKPFSKPGRVSLRINEFDMLLDNQGTYVRITPAVLCPNRSGDQNDEASVNHPMDCSLCDGNQIVDLASLSFTTWAFIASLKIEPHMDITRYDVKDAVMSTQTDVKVHYWYKVEMIDHTSQFNQLIKRGTSNIDKLRYEPKDTEDGALYCLVDSAGSLYVRNVDYSLSGREITWTTTRRPEVDSIYSFMYPVLPTYRIIDLLHENRFYYNSDKLPVRTPVNLPQQAHLRWDFMTKNVEAT